MIGDLLNYDNVKQNAKIAGSAYRAGTKLEDPIALFRNFGMAEQKLYNGFMDSYTRGLEFVVNTKAKDIDTMLFERFDVLKTQAGLFGYVAGIKQQPMVVPDDASRSYAISYEIGYKIGFMLKQAFEGNSISEDQVPKTAAALAKFKADKRRKSING